MGCNIRNMAQGKRSGFSWDYSERSDILNIHKEGFVTDGSAELDDFTIDFSKTGEVVGVEIMNASEFLEPAGVTRGQLAKIEAGEVKVDRRKECDIVWVKLSFSDGNERMIPIPAPVAMEAE
ncbi:MAG: DUF2283 domain-containing protein [Nanoarchaeota archaeon]